MLTPFAQSNRHDGSLRFRRIDIRAIETVHDELLTYSCNSFLLILLITVFSICICDSHTLSFPTSIWYLIQFYCSINLIRNDISTQFKLINSFKKLSCASVCTACDGFPYATRDVRFCQLPCTAGHHYDIVIIISARTVHWCSLKNLI